MKKIDIILMEYHKVQEFTNCKLGGVPSPPEGLCRENRLSIDSREVG